MEYQIEITDTIGYWECSYAYIKQQLNKCKDKPVCVKISSLGGDANEALKIYQLFKDHGDVTGYLSGLVASAATIIALGCKKTVVGKNSLYLIHNCLNWVDTWGMMNKEEIHEAIADLRKTISTQEKIDHLAASLYAEKCGKKIEDIKKIMTKNEWMTPDEALELGLVDEVTESKNNETNNMNLMVRMEACNLPDLPKDFAFGKEENNFMRSASVSEFARNIATELAKVFNPNPKNPIVKETTQNTQMNKMFTTVMALLAIEAMTEKDGTISVTVEQMKMLDDKMKSLMSADTEKADAEKKVNELTAQMQAMSESKQQIENEKSDLEKKLNEANEQIAALKAQTPEIPGVKQQPKDDDIELSEEEAMKIAQAYMQM